MTIIITLLIVLVMLGLLIFVHEMGHFIAARLAGIRVEEFGMGFPPRLFAVKRGETVYSINAIPIGGFCRLLGEEDPDEPRSFASKSAVVRLAVLGAGPLMNALLPIVILTVAFMVPRQVVVGDVMIDEVALNSPAAEAGLAPGDIILSVNGHSIQNAGDLVYNIHLSLGEETMLELEEADGSQKTAALVPRWDPPEGEGAVGVRYSVVNAYEVSESDPFWEAVPKSATTTWETFGLLRNEVRIWFARGTAPQVGGVVAIYRLTGEIKEGGPSYLLQFAASLSVILAVINLIPIPALDGGRIAFILLEIARRGKRVSPRTEGLVHLAGFMMLIGVVLLVTYFDIVRWIRGDSVIP